MENKKRVTILVIIALVLAITAIALNTNDSKQIPTPSSSTPKSISPTGAVVGIEIEPSPIEDKLSGDQA